MTPNASRPPLVVVTGGLARIGAAISARFARGGCDLAIHRLHGDEPAPDLAAALAETGVAWHRFRADLSDRDDAKALIPAIKAHFGRSPDVLVNSASLFEKGGWEQGDRDALGRAFEVNTFAPLLLARAVVDAAGPDTRPSIVNVLDQRVRSPVPDQFAYTLSKQALWQATRTCAVAFGGRARVNAVAPGPTLPTEDYDEGQWRGIADKLPLRALSTPGQIADAVHFLAFSEATTGQTLFVDGGAGLIAWPRDFLYL